MSDLPNKLGVRLVVPLTKGRIFCALWNDKQLGSELELFFGDDSTVGGMCASKMHVESY